MKQKLLWSRLGLLCSNQKVSIELPKQLLVLLEHRPKNVGPSKDDFGFSSICLKFSNYLHSAKKRQIRSKTVLIFGVKQFYIVFYCFIHKLFITLFINFIYKLKHHVPTVLFEVSIDSGVDILSIVLSPAERTISNRMSQLSFSPCIKTPLWHPQVVSKVLLYACDLLTLLIIVIVWLVDWLFTTLAGITVVLESSDRNMRSRPFEAYFKLQLLVI